MTRRIFNSGYMAFLLFAIWMMLSACAHAQVYYAKEMTTEQYRTLDRGKTVVMLPVSILEEHGPYLPAYTDGYITERLVQDVSGAIVEKGWSVLVLPIIPLGSGGANELAAKYPFPGTFAVRASTLRTLLMDWATELGDSGFRWIFLANDHGAPNHNRILDQVCDYFNETYGGHMTVLRGISTSRTAKIDEELRNMLSEKAREEDAASGHAGIDETSLMLFLQPELVDPAYRGAPPQTASGFDGMLRVAKGENWPGYFGSPRFSSAAYGARMYRSRSERVIEQAIKTLDGTAPQAPGFGAAISPIHDAALKRDEEIEKKQQEWLKKKGIK